MEAPTMLKGAVIGYGFIAEHGHLPAYAASRAAGLPIEIVAVADSCAPRLAKAKAAYPHLRAYDDYRRMLDGERDLDFVDISTPPSEHAALAHTALDHGLHVFCEKPMATTAKDAVSMLDHARRARRVLFPSHNYKHAPVVRAVRRVLDEGSIGKVKLVTLQTFRNTHAKGVAEWRPDWRRERRYSGGGIAMDHGSHTFYLAFDWLGGFPTSITAKASTLGAYDTEDDLSCTITFPRGIVNAHLTWNAGVRKVIYTIHGEQGAIRVEDDDVEVSVAKKDADGRTSWDFQRERIPSNWMDASHVEWFRSVFARFVDAIDRREYVGRDAIESFKCVELIETAYESSRQGSRELPLHEPLRQGTRELALPAG
jgi:predicted dehydrogenase